MYTFSNILPRALASFALTSLALLAPACDPELTGESAPVEANADDLVTPASLGLGDRWVYLEDGLWTRSDDIGEQEYAAIGEAGMPHAIASLKEVELELEQALAARPSDETRDQLVELREYITGLQTSPWTLPADEISPRCTVTITAAGSAQPIACGASASASASYTNTCDAAHKTISTYAIAHCNGEAKTHSCGRTGNPVSCSSSAAITGAASCYSKAYFQIPNAAVWKNNYLRGACGGPGGTMGTGVTTVNDPPCGGPNQQICP